MKVLTRKKSITVQIVNKSADLDHLKESWNEMAKGNPFLTWDWNQAWWEHLGSLKKAWKPGNRLFILLVKDSSKIIGLAPWYIHFSPMRGRVLQFLGTGQACSEYQGILSRSGEELHVAQAIVSFLINEGNKIWDKIEMNNFKLENKTNALFLEELKKEKISLIEKIGHYCWRLELPSQWEDYLGKKSKRHRSNLKRLDREYLESGKAKVVWAKSEKEYVRGMKILFELHRKRRKSLGVKTNFEDVHFQKFHLTVARRFFDRGKLQLKWLEIENEPAAVLYDLAGEESIYGYSSGINPDCLESSPGKIIFIATFKKAIREKVRIYDFLRGDEPYKAHWRAEPFKSWEVYAINNNFKAKMRNSLWYLGANVKSWLSQINYKNGVTKNNGKFNGN